MYRTMIIVALICILLVACETKSTLLHKAYNEETLSTDLEQLSKKLTSEEYYILKESIEFNKEKIDAEECLSYGWLLSDGKLRKFEREIEEMRRMDPKYIQEKLSQYITVTCSKKEFNEGQAGTDRLCENNRRSS